MIQFITQILLFTKGASITDYQFLYIDLVALIPLSVFQAQTGSYHKLTKDMPTDTLFYGPVLISVGVSALIQLVFQVFYYMNVQKQPFYIPPYNIGTDNTLQNQKYVSYEDTVLFYISNFQYIVTCVSFSISKPFRKQIWTNSPYFVSLILLVIFNTVDLFVPPNTPIFSIFTCLPFETQTG